ncbi:MAG: M3 family metallopeptidase, partial [Ginsengibacter sp.]
SILSELSNDVIDYSGLEKFRENGWQKQLHLFEVPFYYIEYGIAQLGALDLYKQYKEDPKKAIKNYISALSLGSTKTLPELYKAAGLRFDFSADYVKSLMDFLSGELQKLKK